MNLPSGLLRCATEYLFVLIHGSKYFLSIISDSLAGHIFGHYYYYHFANFKHKIRRFCNKLHVISGSRRTSFTRVLPHLERTAVHPQKKFLYLYSLRVKLSGLATTPMKQLTGLKRNMRVLYYFKYFRLADFAGFFSIAFPFLKD